MVKTEGRSYGVDTPEDLKKVERYMVKDELIGSYLI